METYGVLKGYAVDRRLGQGSSPHYQIHIVDTDSDYRIAINVRSTIAPYDVEYLVDDRFTHPITTELQDLPLGFTRLDDRRPGAIALDYIRGNLFQRDKLIPLPFNVPGPDNDLNEKVDAQIQRAIGDEQALVYAFGESFHNNRRDRYFGFMPGKGMHNIHMNQGNTGRFESENGVWQDGGLLIHFPLMDQWVAIFLKFQSQVWHTDEVMGRSIIEMPQLIPTRPAGMVRIVAALVNPADSPAQKTVTLLNTSPSSVDLTDWAIMDKFQNRRSLSGLLEPGSTQIITIATPMQLSNNGGIITLLDDQGMKVDGVSYTREQAHKPGWSVVF
jgi:uncharacterized protein YukJ